MVTLYGDEWRLEDTPINQPNNKTNRVGFLRSSFVLFFLPFVFFLGDCPSVSFRDSLGCC